jgi:signal transduction histidine kinase
MITFLNNITAKIFRQRKEKENVKVKTHTHLTIPKGFITLLKGEIWHESDLGNCSWSYFTVPYQPATTQSIPDILKIKIS